MRLENRSVEVEIPTSSMADIAFLLIIFFMITATFTLTRGLDFDLPRDDRTELVEPERSILLEIQRDGRIELDSKPVLLRSLLAELAPKLERSPGKPVLVRPAADAEYGSLVDVLDELRQGKEVLHLEQEIRIALPTEREITSFWR